jgi:hypothetical protein
MSTLKTSNRFFQNAVRSRRPGKMDITKRENKKETVIMRKSIKLKMGGMSYFFSHPRQSYKECTFLHTFY